MNKTIGFYSIAALAFAVLSPQALAYSWTISRIPSLGGPYQNPRVFDLNNAGQIVGDASIASGGSHAFIYERGVIRDLGVVGNGRSSTAESINNNGAIVGSLQTGEVDQYGTAIYRNFIYQNGAASHLDGLHSANAINDNGLVAGGTQWRAQLYDSRTQQVLWTENTAGFISHAEHINDSGQVTGRDFDDWEEYGHAFFYDPATGIKTRIDPAGSSSASAQAINDAGQVVGVASIGYNPAAFTYYNGVSTVYVSPFGYGSTAGDINNHGQIGRSLEIDPNGEMPVWHAFFDSGENLMDLNNNFTLDNGDYLREVLHLNDRGDMVVRSNHFRTYYLEALPAPIPEAETWSMLLMGVGLTVWVRRRSRGSAAGC